MTNQSQDKSNNFIPQHPLKTAVLFLIFNRLDTTKKVFETIRKAKPPRLYIAADGAREKRQGENEKVKMVREYVMENIDWDCEIKTLFREKNLGCKMAVSSAIDWFFKNEEMGIILEDDCLPNQSFFWFCEELLDKYKNDKSVMMISGNCFLKDVHIREDYFFSKYNHIWGWGTWKDSWESFSLSCSDFKKSFSEMTDLFSSEKEKKYWRKIFKAYFSGKIDVWGYPWTFTIWRNKGKCIYPRLNMVKNIGFSQEATHTKKGNRLMNNIVANDLILRDYPNAIEINWDLDRKNFDIVFAPKSLWTRIVNRLKLIYRNEQFNPKILGLFINPFYFARKGLYKNVFELIINLRGKVLDIGCGSKPYKNLCNCTEYIGLEVDTFKNRQNKKADFFYDGNSIPFEDNDFDSLILSQVFEHVFDSNEFLREINRVTKMGGVLLMTVPFVWDEHEQPYDYGRYSSFGLKHILLKNGFEIIEHRKTVNNIGIIFQLINVYIFKVTLTKNTYLNFLIILLLMAPINIVGIVLLKIFPKNNDLYLDNVVLAKKIKKPYYENKIR